METEPSAKTKVVQLPQLRRSEQKAGPTATFQISVVHRTNQPPSQAPHTQRRSCLIVPDRRGWGRHDSSHEPQGPPASHRPCI